MTLDKIRIFTGNSNSSLSTEICEFLKVPLGQAMVKSFSDGEIAVEIQENIRGRHVFVIQSTCTPVNHNIMELLVMIDAMKRASAGYITAVIPYYGYARQDRKAAPRTPITAKLVADLITAAGATRLLSMDLHAGQIQGFFNIPVDHIYAMPVVLDYIKEHMGDDIVVVSPDAGGVERSRAYAKRLGAALAIIDKRRTGPNVAEVMHIIGDVEGKTAIIVDDMVDTAGTLTQAAKALMENGAKSVCASCTHAVLSGPAIERIENSAIEQLVITNSIPLTEAGRNCEKIKVLSVASLLGEAIRRIHSDDSVSSLFV
ncbi:MAG: ribose-phosphate pyrophosphokinase [Proteobacteria bacterium]|nr:ribose-phosphate pyrophosphokinase [Pseudomonadota bacterium]